MTGGMRKTLSVGSARPAKPALAPGASQFEFLAPFPWFLDYARGAEMRARADALGAALRSRLAVEAMVRWLYDNDTGLSVPFENSLNALTAEPAFRSLVGPAVATKIAIVRRIGNSAAHPGRFVESQAVAAVRELFEIAYWFASHYSEAPPPASLAFDSELLPHAELVDKTTLAAAIAQIKAAQDDRDALEAERAARMKDADARATLETELAAARAEMTALRKANAESDARHDYHEAETRDRYIDLLLGEAGWKLEDARDREFEVAGMPSDSGVGFVDYVLWGDDGKPLGLVEAKRTRKDPRQGKRQAELYADCLEQQFGQRPVIFYTNGYDHWIWDDQRYPPRAIQSFLTKEELALIIQRRTSRLALDRVPTNRAIAERTYQEKAIRAVAGRFDAENQRKALLVMATGSGKTRTVIALSDVLMRANWAKRILFLADRTALVNQATNAFKAHLPSVPVVNLLKDKNAEGRVFVSTYPTMMGLIEDARAAGKGRFGPGFFDLVVIDEAHRSVYRKYRAIFDWFDSHLIGLTATPKDEVDKNTYDLFELQTGVPTDAYDLQTAVRDGWLVPPRALDVPLAFPRTGIRYDDLSEAEKEEWDAKEWGEGGPPDEVDANDVNTYLFNADTIDKMLEQLMRDGQKVDDGEMLGKTIIFAKNHRHAQFIVERFDVNYPHHKGKFCALIDNEVRYAQSLIDDFSVPSKRPQIAVSVDMLDTGIDIPEVVNLVFLKIVRSKSKFWQMIGRGTRLCENLFGPGVDKVFFYVFDYLGNVAFFNADLARADPAAARPLGERLFAARVELVGLMQSPPESKGVEFQPEEYLSGSEPNLIDGLRTQLRREIDGIPIDNFVVRPKRRTVEKYREDDVWRRLTEDDRAELVEQLAGLPTSEIDPDTDAKRFDLLCLTIQLSLLRNQTFEQPRKRFMELMQALEGKASVPAVAKEMVLIQDAETADYWAYATPDIIEVARRRLRSLIALIEVGQRAIITTNFIDTMGEASEIEFADLGDAASLAVFRRKARTYLRTHQDHVAIARLRQGRPLTPTDLNELDKIFLDAGIADAEQLGSMRAVPGLPAFIRSLVGLDRQAAQVAFNEALSGITLTPQQIDFVERIIDQLTASGAMDPARLYEPPYTDSHPNGIGDVFPKPVVLKVIATIRDFEPRYAPNTTQAGSKG